MAKIGVSANRSYYLSRRYSESDARRRTSFLTSVVITQEAWRALRSFRAPRLIISFFRATAAYVVGAVLF